MRVFVTGAAGYIGSVVTEHLLAAGHEVIAYDNLSSGHRNALPHEVDFVQGDILDSSTLESELAAAKAEAVMHLAGEIVVSESYRDPGKHFRANVIGGIDLLEAMRKVGTKQIVFSSTAGVYGAPKSLPILEDAEKNPVSPYGLSKLQFENILFWYEQAYGFRHVSLRYFNACGATELNGEDRSNETHLIPLLLDVVQGKRPSISLFGTDYPTPDGTCIRDYVHVADIARAHVQVLESLDRLKSPAYNLGTGVGHSNREVIASVEGVTGKVIPTLEAAKRPGDPPELVASAQKIEQDLGWKPQSADLQVMIESAWKWRQSHPNGYEE